MYTLLSMYSSVNIVAWFLTSMKIENKKWFISYRNYTLNGRIYCFQTAFHLDCTMILDRVDFYNLFYISVYTISRWHYSPLFTIVFWWRLSLLFSITRYYSFRSSIHFNIDLTLIFLSIEFWVFWLFLSYSFYKP